MARWLVAIALLTAGCEKSVFNCDVDEDCTLGSMPGSCDDHLCSFPTTDPNCVVGRKYSEYSGEASGQCVPVNYMFVTRDTLPPAMFATGDPLVMADAFCNTAAGSASLPGHYIAWISTPTKDARDRLSESQARGWIRRDNLPFIDMTPDLVVAGGQEILYPPRIDEYGDDLVNDPIPYAVTGTSPDGTYDSTNSPDWSTYRVGHVSATRNGWTDAIGKTGMAHVYCFGTDHQVAPPIPNETGSPIAFVSATAFSVTGGVTAADNLCEADAAKLSGPRGHFHALLATSSAKAIDPSRFQASSTLRFVRPDGLPLEIGPGDLIGSGKLAAPIAMDPSQNFNNTPLKIWTGAQDPSKKSQPGENCADWTGAGGGSAIAGMDNDSGPTFFHIANSSPLTCTATTVHVYCLQYMQ